VNQFYFYFVALLTLSFRYAVLTIISD